MFDLPPRQDAPVDNPWLLPEHIEIVQKTLHWLRCQEALYAARGNTLDDEYYDLPEVTFDMASTLRRDNCGTVACIAGHALIISELGEDYRDPDFRRVDEAVHAINCTPNRLARAGALMGADRMPRVHPGDDDTLSLSDYWSVLFCYWPNSFASDDPRTGIVALERMLLGQHPWTGARLPRPGESTAADSLEPPDR
jgi:hypothetical protein